MRRSGRLAMVAVSVCVLLLVGGAPGVATVPGPNGRILFTIDTRNCDDCHLTTIDPDGTDPDRVEGFIAFWSPDGTRITTAENAPDGRLTTGVMDADGSNLIVFALTDPTLNAGCLVWFADASHFLCEGWDEVRRHRPAGVFEVSAADGTGLTRLTTNPYGGNDFPADVSPDGTRFVFVRENPARRHRHASIWVAAIDGSGETRISPWLEGYLCCQPDWSPDGSKILYTAKGIPVSVAPDGTDREFIDLDAPLDDSYTLQPHWSPDGTRIVVAAYLPGESQSDLWTVAADGTDPVQVTASARSEQWPDWGPAPTVP